MGSEMCIRDSYRITVVGINEEDGSKLDLTLDTTGPAPLPSLGEARPVDHDGDSGVPFVIHRQPRRLESSLVELPEGYIIDLRYSGPLLTADTPEAAKAGTLFNQNQSDGFLAGGDPFGIVLHFDASGGISRVFFVDTNHLPLIGTEAIKSIQPISALNWLVTEYDPNAIGANGNYVSVLDDPIFQPNNKWVTVDHLTGGVHVASTAVPQAPANLRDAILQSLAIAVDRQSARQ